VKDCTEPCFNGDLPAGEGDTDVVCLAGEAVNRERNALNLGRWAWILLTFSLLN